MNNIRSILTKRRLWLPVAALILAILLLLGTLCGCYGIDYQPYQMDPAEDLTAPSDSQGELYDAGEFIIDITTTAADVTEPNAPPTESVITDGTQAQPLETLENTNDTTAATTAEIVEKKTTTTVTKKTKQKKTTTSAKWTTTTTTTTTTVTTTTTTTAAPAIDEDGFYYSKKEVALYIHTYGHLPENFITKREANDLGWNGGSLERYKKGYAIGGDRFSNREGILPKKSGRVYTECDIDTKGKNSRGAKRIVFSNDGLIFYTDDHYETFTQLY